MKEKVERVHYTVDFRGSIASITLLELTTLFREMKNNELMEIHANDTGTISDIFRVLPESEFELSDWQDENSEYVIRIKKQPVK